MKYHALALNSIRLFCNTGLSGFSDQMGPYSFFPCWSRSVHPSCFLQSTWQGQFSMFTSSTTDLLMHRICPSARTTVCARLGTSGTQNKFCTSQQYVPIPCTILWALGKESSWEEAAGAGTLSTAWAKPSPPPAKVCLGRDSKQKWLDGESWRQQPTPGRSPAFRFPWSTGPSQKGFIGTVPRKGIS